MTGFSAHGGVAYNWGRCCKAVMGPSPRSRRKNSRDDNPAY